ncbi:MAG: hypothetical protein AB1638_07420 [Nitrospirota bacterium]
MAKLTLLLVNRENMAFMHKVAVFNKGKLEQGCLTISVTAPEIVVKREWADEIFRLNVEDADSKWRSLLLNHSGKVRRFSDDEIIIADQEGP